MKISIKKLTPVPKYIPKSTTDNFAEEKDYSVCVYGNIDDETKNWVSHHGFKTYNSGKYTNIVIPHGTVIENLFTAGQMFDYMDGFSPNLNKKLHIGHFSNLVLCKAFKSLGVCKQTVSIYGDTLDGVVSKEEALKQLSYYHKQFDFSPDVTFMASEVVYQGNLLVPGEGNKQGAMVFKIGETQMVGIKSSGQTSYFYQDCALAEKLNASTLYLTGSEQIPHFALLQQMYPLIQHIGLGLVKVDGLKMSSREGNVIFVEDFLSEMNNIFESDSQLIYNVFAGYILKSGPESDKNINIKTIDNPKNSAGLYISYTMARLNKAGCDLKASEAFKSLSLGFALIKSQVCLKPNILFEAIVEHCKDINALYVTHHIKDNVENTAMFNEKLSDLVLGCNYLGMFPVKYVGNNSK